MCEHAIKQLPYLSKYVPDKYNTQQICDKAILENCGTLKYVPDSIPDQLKTKEMCNLTVSLYFPFKCIVLTNI